MQHSRSNNADAAFPLRIPQTLHSPGSLVERGQPGTEVGWITTVCKHQHTEIQPKLWVWRAAFTSLEWGKTTHQLAFQPVALRFPWGPQPTGKWSLPSYWHGSPYPGNTRTGWFLWQTQQPAAGYSAERNSMLICNHKYVNKPNDLIYILMETDNGSYSFFLLMSLLSFFFLLLLFISSHSPRFCLWTTQIHLTFMCISLKRHCSVTDATLSLTEIMNKDSSNYKMSPSLSNHQNTRVRKGRVLSELSDNCS